jgi:hypothetical protein
LIAVATATAASITSAAITVCFMSSVRGR